MGEWKASGSSGLVFKNGRAVSGTQVGGHSLTTVGGGSNANVEKEDKHAERSTTGVYSLGSYATV
jgi:hypothetical protein